MAAYGALSSLLLSLDNILGRRQPISLDRRQLRSLQGKTKLLLQRLERPSTGTRDRFVGSHERIRDVASRASHLIANTMYHDRRYMLSVPDHIYFLAKFFLIFSALGILFMPWSRIILVCYIATRSMIIVLCYTVLAACLISLLMEVYPSLLLLIENLPSLWVRSDAKGQDLSKMLEEIDSLVEEANTVGVEEEDPWRPTRDVSISPASSSRRCETAVVGMGSDLEEIQERLFYGSPKLEIVSVVGMGGIGKTTLARCIYNDSNSNHHFDICMWVTISQQRGLLRVLHDLLASAKLLTLEMQEESDDGVLGDYLYKALIGRRYLIVMDDVWDIEIWDAMRRSFPDDKNGSRVLLTTRLSEVARYTSPCSAPHRMQFLNQEEGWSLLCDRVFGGESCPHELREIGDEIVHNCRGLPLAIVVTGGLLSKIDRTKENWRNFADSLRSTSTKDDDECMKIILALSYDHLPHHLRPCFLYMGMFPEDYAIPFNKLAWLWAAEGFLQSESCKSPEELAENYLQDLVERNLILVHVRGSQGKIKTCMMHDVLRNLCQHWACEEKFLYVANDHADVLSEGREPCCRLSIHPDALKAHPDILFDDELHNSRAHSVLCIGTNHMSSQRNCLRYRLLRVLDLLTIHFVDFPLEIPNLISLRYLALTFTGRLHPYISKLQNLQTLVHHDIISHKDSILPVEIWLLQRLRHLIVPSPCLPSGSLTRVSHSLQTLEKVTNLAFGVKILNQINSLNKLSVSYNVTLPSFMGWSAHGLENLVCLEQLEKLTLWVDYGIRIPSNPSYLPNLALPRLLKRLTLGGCRIPWELMIHVGALPNLEVLRLRQNACRGAEWEPVEGQFRNLKSLLIQGMDELEQWVADDTHFPLLRRLVVNSCPGLREIPVSIGDIETLERIELIDCHPRVVTSAERIREEQRDMGNSDLNLRIYRTRAFQERMRR